MALPSRTVFAVNDFVGGDVAYISASDSVGDLDRGRSAAAFAASFFKRCWLVSESFLCNFLCFESQFKELDLKFLNGADDADDAAAVMGGATRGSRAL